LSSVAAKSFSDQLAGTGAVALLQARVWEEFTGRVVSALRQAMDVLSSGDHEKKIGYWCKGTRSIKGTKVHLPQEDSITHALTEALEIVRQHSAPDDFLKKRQISFPQQQPRPKQSRLGKSALTTDIRAYSLEEIYLDLRIEAKVLFGSSDVTHYCGEKGLLRFSNPEPYTQQAVGMMVGYSVRHDDGHWTKRIEAKASGVAPVKSFQVIDLGGEELLSSTLASHACGEVLVVHLMLPFETKPSARQIDTLGKPSQ
jgi:hypothetical protein